MQKQKRKTDLPSTLIIGQEMESQRLFSYICWNNFKPLKLVHSNINQRHPNQWKCSKSEGTHSIDYENSPTSFKTVSSVITAKCYNNEQIQCEI